MSKTRIPRNGKYAIALGGRKRPLEPYAIRVDIGLYDAKRLIEASKKEGAGYSLKSLGRQLEEALEPFTAKAPTP